MPIFEFPLLFPSDGVMLVGRVHRNTDDLVEPQPTVIVSGSWLTVKEQMPRVYARALAERGFTTFTFDFAGFGESGGEPRQLEHPERKIRDIIAAASFLRTLSFSRDRVPGHLAVCASAQYALAAIARGAPISSFASVAGWYHDAASVAAFYGGASGTAMRLERAKRAMEAYATSRTDTMVPVYRAGDDRAGMFFELDYYGSSERGAVPEWKNEMAEMSWAFWLTFDGLSAATNVSLPTVMVHGDGCVLPDNARAIHAALQGPKRLEWIDGTQTDFYDRPAQVSKAIEIVDRHFRDTLSRG
jgi:uncharacterized protein